MALAILCLATLVELVDVTIVNISLLQMKASLGMSDSSATWVLTGYLVTFGGLLLLGGRLGDLLGKRKVFLVGVAIFTLSSVACGSAPSSSFLIGARLTQGVGASLMAPMTLALIFSIFEEGQSRTRAMAVWGAVTGISGSLGVALGGVLSDGPGWRWIFFVNVPIGAAILILGPWLLPSDDASSKRSAKSFDLLGAALATASVALVIYGVSHVEAQSWLGIRTGGAALLGAELLVAFVIWERRSKFPLVDLSILRLRTVAGANCIAVIGVGGQYAIFFVFSVYSQEVAGFTPTVAGLLFLPMTMCSVVVANRVPFLITKIGVPHLMFVGVFLNIVGLLMFAAGTMDYDLWLSVVLPSVIFGCGSPCWFVPMSIAAVDKVPVALTGLASGFLNANRTIGGALGVALVATILSANANHSATYAVRLAYIATAIMYCLVLVIVAAFFRGAKSRGR